MLAVFYYAFPVSEDPDTWEATSELERSAFYFLFALKADEHISFLKSFVNAKVDSF